MARPLTPTLIYTDTLADLTPDHLHGFFVGWPQPPTPQQHLRLLHGSAHVWLARAGATGPVVGFVNALSDGVLSAFIPNLEVLPAYQGHGIGSELMRRMLTTLRHHYGIDLVCDPDLRPFYARLGAFEVAGMVWRNRDALAQAGAPQ